MRNVPKCFKYYVSRRVFAKKWRERAKDAPPPPSPDANGSMPSSWIMICIASGNIQHIIQRVLRRYTAPFPLTEAIFMQNGAGKGTAGTVSKTR